MRHFHLTKNKYHRPAVNLDKLWSLVSEQTRQYYQDKTDGPVPVIDVVRAVSMLNCNYFLLIPCLVHVVSHSHAPSKGEDHNLRSPNQIPIFLSFYSL